MTGTSTSGPLYGNATTNLLEFDDQGNFVREIVRAWRQVDRLAEIGGISLACRALPLARMLA